MKILYIPAENVKTHVSRSYFIAKGFSSHHDVYKVFWHDNRNRFWEGKPASPLYTAQCFIKSLFTLIRVEKSNDFGYTVFGSVFINAFIGKIIGNYRSIRLMRQHNLNTLKKIVDKIQPDIIYHADGFYFFPALNSTVPEFSDLQDDINWKKIPTNNLKDEQDYYTNQFNKTKLNFIVSASAAKSFNRFVNCKFVPFDNGADFNTLQNFNQQELEQLKIRFKIPSHKTLISYIGGAHKFDENFTLKLANACLEHLPNVHFLLVGNLPKVNQSNISNLGLIAANEANKIYAISAIGITLKNTENDDFLYNSVPLKFIQYAAARKPIITFPIKWSEDNGFNNIFHVNGEDLNKWIKTIREVSVNFKWTTELEGVWKNYDWQTISNQVFSQMKEKLNNPLNK